jgi:pilus assembly protein CpaB
MYRVVSRKPAGHEVKTVDVIVAQHPLKLGAAIAKSDVKLARWPADTQIPGAFAKVEDVLARGLITDVEENEPLTNAKLAPREAGAGLPPSIPAGMRAISVKVNEVIGVAGFVVPGTRVDVLVTLTSRQQQESTSRVVVGNVQVLTAGTRYDQENAKAGKPIPSTVVTLLVSPEDGERIALASAEGQIMLTLRNPLDTAPTATTGVGTAGLFGSQPTSIVAKPHVKATPTARAADAAVTPAPPPAPLHYTVEAIRGQKRSEEIVR